MNKGHSSRIQIRKNLEWSDFDAGWSLPAACFIFFFHSLDDLVLQVKHIFLGAIHDLAQETFEFGISFKLLQRRGLFIKIVVEHTLQCQVSVHASLRHRQAR